MRWLWFPLCLFMAQLNAQTTDNLVAYYSFDDNTVNNTLNDSIGINGRPQGRFEPTFDCGAIGDALELDGTDRRVDFGGALVNNFKVADISVSFYFKPLNPNGIQLLLSKYGDPCPTDNSIAVRYNANAKTIVAMLSQHDNKQVILEAPIDPNACWQHVAIVRKTAVFQLYINGELMEEGRTSNRADIENNAPLSLGGIPCPDAREVPFRGLVDELRIYRSALSKADIQDLYIAPDKIKTEDALVVLGESVEINTSFSCAFDFRWSPTEGITDVSDPNTTITPSKSGEVIYTLEFDDGSCIATDEILINAVNPEELDCNVIFLPNAFTPNDDGRNDTYGISNPFAVDQILSFEIFDRWGSRVFETTEANAVWDGKFKGVPVNAGMMLYKVRYMCKGEEVLKTGSVKVFR